MTTLREAAQQALEACTDAVMGWQSLAPLSVRSAAMESLDALRDALAQQEQQPVAWMYEGIRHDGTAHGPHLVWKPEYMDAMSANKGAKAAPLYTQPSRREWQGLTDTDRARVFRALYGGGRFGVSEKEFAIAIEAALKEKNA